MCNVCMMTQTFVPDRHQPGQPLFEGIAQNFANTFTETTDAADSTATTYTMGVGDTFQGSIGTGGDVDWIKIDFEAGKTYRIDALGSDSAGGGTVRSTDLILYDGSGNFIEENLTGGAGLDAQITYTATQTATFYIAVDAFQSTSTGTYNLVVQEAVTIPPPGGVGTYEELAQFLKTSTGTIERTFNTTTSNVITVNISGLEADGQQLALWAMEAWEMVVDIDFQVVTSGEMITADDEDSGAFAYFPNSGSTSTSGPNPDNTDGVELNVSKAWLQNYGTSIDSYSFQTYVHEFGHAIGLHHLGAYNFTGSPITWQNDAYFTNDSWQMSIMSYFDQGENLSTRGTYALVAGPMLADIMAAQDFYGAPGASSATAGNTVFGHGSNLGNYMDEVFNSIVSGIATANTNGNFMAYTIYDQGGVDLLDLSPTPSSRNLRIDLNDGAFSDVGFNLDVIGIAVGTIIENLNLGAGNDTAIGNEADNTIDGGQGNDTITGGMGNDVLSGGAGNDRGVLEGALSNFQVYSYGGLIGTLDLVGTEGNDLFDGFENLQFNGSLTGLGGFSSFEAMRYLASNLDLVPQVGMDGELSFTHYITQGYAAGRQITFNALGYIASHADLIAAFGDDTETASLHYAFFGVNEGREVTFSGLEYLASYADLRVAFGTDAETATLHYILFGANEGREVTFSGLEYLASYADLRAAYGTDAETAALHYILFGANEGREVTFSGLEYIASYADLIVAFGTDSETAALHYILFGANEGREVTFSGLEYIASYADLIVAFGTDVETAAQHYILYGVNEGRSVTFDGYSYLASQLDLLALYGADAEAATIQYIQTGVNEGRVWDDRAGLDEITSGQTGTSGGEAITGGTEAELLAGMGGADMLNGGGGDDVLFGGAGSDTFVFADNFGNDVIADFNALDDNEEIDLSGVTGILDYNDLVDNHLTTINGVVTITNGADSIALNGVNIGDLDMEDFIFV